MGAADALRLNPDCLGRALYLPALDQVLLRIAGFIDAQAGTAPRPATQWGAVIIASQLGMEGGHSRVIEDICASMPDPLLVITDAFGSYAQGKMGLDSFVRRNPDTMVVVLKDAGLLEKAKELHTLCKSLDPDAIFILAHHQDPVAFAAVPAVASRPGARKFLVHHTDHSPALGVSMGSFVHVDCSEHLRTICEKGLGRACHLLPLTADDLGPRTGRALGNGVVSTVSSGSHAKFSRAGEFAYSKIVTRILSTIKGPHHHIGMLPEDWLDEIRTTLATNGIAPARFAYIGTVPSLWEALKTLPADLYVASAPVGGGRAAIEAQGCGYPVAYFKNGQQPFLFQIDELYASRNLEWGSIDELGKCLAIDGASLRQHAEAARAFFLAGHCRNTFRQAIGRLLAADPP